MSGPKGQHFLAREACLKGFCAAGTEQVWLYRRGGRPVLTNIANVAKHHYLYSYDDQAGKRNDDFETRFFSKIDGAAAVIFRNLRGAVGPKILITEDELAELVQYIAIQFVRTPAFRSMRKGHGMYAAETARNLSANEIRELRESLPPGLIPPGFANSDEEFRQRWTEALSEAEARFADKRSWLAEMHQFARVIAQVLWEKHVELLRVAHEYFITCDQAVVVDYALNFATSDIYFPIGSTTALYFDRSRARDRSLTIPIRNISGSEAQAFNHRIILAAENELYGAINREDIQEAFTSAPVPGRFPPIAAAEILGLSRK
jgi:broad specificity phosphatase PhoE